MQVLSFGNPIILCKKNNIVVLMIEDMKEKTSEKSMGRMRFERLKNRGNQQK